MKEEGILGFWGIASYFEQVYKRPEHMQASPDEERQTDIDMADEMINTTGMFSLEDIREATK